MNTNKGLKVAGPKWVIRVAFFLLAAQILLGILFLQRALPADNKLPEVEQELTYLRFDLSDLQFVGVALESKTDGDTNNVSDVIPWSVPRMTFEILPSRERQEKAGVARVIELLMPELTSGMRRDNRSTSANPILRTWIIPEYSGATFGTEHYLPRSHRISTGRDMLAYRWDIKVGQKKPPLQMMLPVVIWQYPNSDTSSMPFEGIAGIGFGREF